MMDQEHPRPSLSLDADEVHAWHLSLPTLVPRQEEFLRLLSVDEREKAARYRFEKDRSESILTRGALRLTLEAYGVAEASAIRLAYGARGKPELAPEHEVGSLQFNVSHSHGVAVIAVTRGRRLGVDVETLRDTKERDGIVARFFAEEEQAEYRSLPPDDRLRGFYLGWTRKEAYIKAIGVGLGYPLDSFAVTLTPGSPARFVRLDTDPNLVAGWTLADLTIDPSYVAALAVEGREVRIRNQVWSPPAPLREL